MRPKAHKRNTSEIEKSTAKSNEVEGFFGRTTT